MPRPLTSLLSATGVLLVLCSAGAAEAQSATANATSSATLLRPVSVSSTSNLSFGRIVLPSAGTGVVSVGTASDSVSASSGASALSGATTSRAAFSISGEGGQAVSVSVPASVVMTNAASGSITVTLTSSVAGSTTLSGTLGAAGTATFFVGGSFNASSTTSTGAYSGTFAVTVAYQ